MHVLANQPHGIRRCLTDNGDVDRTDDAPVRVECANLREALEGLRARFSMRGEHRDCRQTVRQQHVLDDALPVQRWSSAAHPSELQSLISISYDVYCFSTNKQL